MKKCLLLLLCFLPVLTFCQTQKSSSSWGTKSPKRPINQYARLGNGGVGIGVGVLCVAGSVVILGEAKSNSNKTAAYILSGAGSIIAILGGVQMSNAGMKIARSQVMARTKFTGTGLIYNF
ncbi:hypothetical protein GFS24_01020 [Chitinophaga sp. SYP-B3965]|uniref:hypothetical protein n=1 Tax=Chitinophaga sp. SYP-B3965 TaxID=2663120 RepID=UPI0012999359|nr:hypothetical protein [Chitinophaga sp. SYP-B3965]MRG43671.1 hypothetical protein [Chitinophaga sp. SYP-B3965]